ncbi:MAG: ATP-grasp domain-containing protein [Luteimonas sp.]
MPRIALATAISATGHDEDMSLLLDACAQAGLEAQALAWDDPTVSWVRFDAVLLRSVWNYQLHLDGFLAWCERVDRASTLLNPLPVLRWNTDKRYLADLEADGLPVIPGTFVDTEEEPLPALSAFLSATPGEDGFVVKPTVGAGAADAQRYTRAQEVAAASHIARLLDSGRNVLLQPYLPAVEQSGETALVYIDGKFSHAARKAALLAGDGTAKAAEESITPSIAQADELALAERVLATVRRRFGHVRPLPYARIDLIRGHDGKPRLLELELTEPSLFLPTAPEAAGRLAGALSSRIRRAEPRFAPQPPAR